LRGRITPALPGDITGYVTDVLRMCRCGGRMSIEQFQSDFFQAVRPSHVFGVTIFRAVFSMWHFQRTAIVALT
jgi:hypothetical protein